MDKSSRTDVSHAKVVVIGAGIVGNSVVHHLAELGWRDLVQIDKGPLPNPGGSTGHASNFIFPVDHNKEMTHLTRDSQMQYEEMGVHTVSGGIETEYVVVACGVWSPRIARMAGATIPLTPAVHQMIDVGPLEILQATGNEIGYPIVRDMDTFCYERQTAGSMEVGSYAHRPIFHHPDTIPSIEEARLSPTELPLTQDDFDPQLEQAIDLMPFLGDAEMRYGINGLLSLTPDAMPLVGETEVRNLWSCAAIWIKEGPGTGRALAEWMTQGYPEVDPHASDIARFYDYQRTEAYVLARCAEHFNKTYGIVHPREQWESERNIRISPFHPATQALGAVYFEAGGWERPHWYESNAELVEKYGDITGTGVVDYIERMTVNKCDVPVGRAVYTPLLTPGGGFKADLTVMRLGDRHFRIISGGFDGPRDNHWFTKHLPDDGSVHFEDQTSAICTVGVWGPRAGDLMARVTDDDLSDEALPYGHSKEVHIGSIPARLFRISYVGEFGYEVYTAMHHGLALWNRLWDAGRDLGVVPVGAGVYGTTGRLEKGYRLMGAELESEYNPVEAGLDRPRVKSADFIGKESYLRARDEDPTAILCTLTMEDHTSSDGTKCYPSGNEPILTADGERIVDAKGRVSRVTSAGAGPSVGKYLLMAYLPPEHAAEGNDLHLMYMNETYPVRVAVVGSTPLFDPDNERMK